MRSSLANLIRVLTILFAFSGRILAVDLACLGESKTCSVFSSIRQTVENGAFAIGNAGVFVFHHHDNGVGIRMMQLSSQLTNTMNPFDEWRRDWQGIRLTPAEIEHGREQLERMLISRPEMATEVNPIMKHFAISHFGRRVNGSLIYWDENAPSGDVLAECELPNNGKAGYIMVSRVHLDGFRRGRVRSAEELWASAVFELFNIRNASAFQAIIAKASAGKLGRDEFVCEMFGIEYRAVQNLRHFYCFQYSQHPSRLGKGSSPEIWYAGNWCSTSDMFKQCANKQSYPWIPFYKYYDRIERERLFKRIYREGF